MTDERMSLQALPGKWADPRLLRAMIGFGPSG